jgi:hypothetical protein
MSRLSNVNDPVREEYVASILAKQAGLQFHITPQNSRFDFMLFDDRDYRVLGEIKIRERFFPDWFIADKKVNWLLEANKTFRCVPWFVIHCIENGVIYRLNLHENYEFTEDSMTNPYSTGIQTETGRKVPIEYWTKTETRSSFEERMSPINWK